MSDRPYTEGEKVFYYFNTNSHGGSRRMVATIIEHPTNSKTGLPSKRVLIKDDATGVESFRNLDRVERYRDLGHIQSDAPDVYQNGWRNSQL